MDTTMRRRRTYFLLFLAATWLAGCGARREFYVAHLDVRQERWDTLRVDVAFAWRTALGGAHPILPETTIVQVFDTDYRTLYRGAGPAVPIPDAELGDRERLMVEICGRLRGRDICVQRQTWASPKRLHVAHDITYPDDGDYDRGRYDLSFRAERQRFGSDAWERLDGVPDVSGYLLAWVDSREEDAVRVPFTRRRGRFDLSRYEHYRDFKYYLDASLLGEKQARVHFAVYAGLKGQVERLASVEKDVELKSRAVRGAEVHFFAEQAAERLIGALSSSFFGRGRRAVAYVDDWEYQPVARRYQAELEVAWGGSFFRDERFELEGLLEVGEDGSAARFVLRSASRAARRRWDDRVGRDGLDLGTFDPPPAMDEQEALFDRDDSF